MREGSCYIVSTRTNWFELCTYDDVYFESFINYYLKRLSVELLVTLGIIAYFNSHFLYLDKETHLLTGFLLN